MRRRIVLIGSFRRDPKQLKSLYSKLSKEYDILCPKSIDFVDPKADFVKAKHELNDSANTIEERVLGAIRDCDFVWLFAPSGYVGPSTSFEIGYAHALGIPIYSTEKPSDEMLASMVTAVLENISDAPNKIHRPGQGIEGLQSYYARASKARGWSKESTVDIMLLLTEEIGELARAIRKSQGLKRDSPYSSVPLADELADVQLYLIHLANSLNISLGNSVTEKEIKNEARYQKTIK